MKTSTLRPGLLVSLKTTVAGNVRYDKQPIEAEHKTDDGKAVETWQTTRIVTDPEEYENAKIARSRAARAIRSVCAMSAFGLLCPESDAEKLAAAIAKAREIADGFNEVAMLTRVTVYDMTGRIAPDDVEAVKAINSEIKDLMAEMERGIGNLDVKVIRDNAKRAKEIGAMLSKDAQARVQIAVDAARSAATKLVQAGETAAREVDRAAMRRIAEQRTAFLDLDDAKAIAAPAVAQTALDLAPAGE